MTELPTDIELRRALLDRELRSKRRAFLEQERRRMRFSKAQWQPIREALSDAQRHRTANWPPASRIVRKSLEQAAEDFCRVGRSAAYREHVRPPSKQERELYKSIAKKARTIVDQMEMLPRLISPADPCRAQRLKQDLTKLSQNAEFWAKGRSRFPPNVDWVRNVAWAQAATIYEQVTGRTVAVSERPDRVAHGPPEGPFVRFIRAWMAAIPDEPDPTGDELRGWYRGHWKKMRCR